MCSGLCVSYHAIFCVAVKAWCWCYGKQPGSSTYSMSPLQELKQTEKRTSLCFYFNTRCLRAFLLQLILVSSTDPPTWGVARYSFSIVNVGLLAASCDLCSACPVYLFWCMAKSCWGCSKNILFPFPRYWTGHCCLKLSKAWDIVLLPTLPAGCVPWSSQCCLFTQKPLRSSQVCWDKMILNWALWVALHCI